MKSIRIAAAMLIAAFSFQLQISAGAEGIAWSKDYKAAMTQAQKENKLVFVDLFTTYCAPCLKLDREVFSTPKFVAVVNKDYVPVKMDADSEGKEFMTKYDVEPQFPCGIIMTPGGKIIKTFHIFMESGKYTAELNKAAKAKR
jgi:uncharacterized protein YyaL (SSP411 family)